jgi:hypothetical protein
VQPVLVRVLRHVLSLRSPMRHCNQIAELHVTLALLWQRALGLKNAMTDILMHVALAQTSRVTSASHAQGDTADCDCTWLAFDSTQKYVTTDQATTRVSCTHRAHHTAPGA